MNISRDFDLNAISPSFIENPYPTIDILRQESPVHENPDGSVYLTRYQDCLEDVLAWLGDKPVRIVESESG